MTMFLKKYRNVLVILAIIVVMVVAYVVVKNSNNHSGTNTPTTIGLTDNKGTISLVEIDTEKIKELTVEINGEKFIYTRKDNLLVATSPTGEKLKANEGEAIASQLKALLAKSVVEKNASDLSKYGLFKPVIITAKLDDGSLKVIEVGDFAPEEIGIYMKLQNDNTVYLVTTDSSYLLKVDRNSMLDTSLFSLKMADITGFTMERQGKVFYSAKRVENNDWKLTSPISVGANVGYLGVILNTVYTVVPTDLVEKNAVDLEKYGLASPKYGYQIETATEKVKILFGNEKEKGLVIYAKMENGKDVYSVSEKYMVFCKDPIIKTVYPFVYTKNVSENSKVVVKIDGKTTTSELNATTQMGNSKNDSYIVNGKSGNAKDKYGNYYFVRYYNSLITLSIDGIDANANPKGNSAVTLIFYPKKANLGVTKIEFISKDSKYYFVMNNGKYTGLTILKSKFNFIRETEKAVLSSLK